MTYKDVIQAFAYASNHKGIDDEFLQNIGCRTREEQPMAGEYSYGIVYLRDDAVEILIQRIIELENQLKAKE